MAIKSKTELKIRDERRRRKRLNPGKKKLDDGKNKTFRRG